MPGFPVFGAGQPTLGGFDKCLEPILKKYGDEKNIFWVNLRQEPVVYVDGKPYSARDPEKLHYHIETKDRVAVGKLGDLQTLTNIFGGIKTKNEKVEAIRIPVNQDKAPDEECFDQIVSLLKNTSASTPIVFNCQAGISRSTTGMIVASLIKEFQLASE